MQSLSKSGSAIEWAGRYGLILLIATLVVGSTEPVIAQTPKVPRKENGKQIALLIGVEKYQKVPKLMFVQNDIQRLAETLRNRGGFNEVVELSDRSQDEKKWPRKDTVMATVATWLKGRRKDDTVIVYFSGHGFRDSAGAMYLAPLDTDPANLTNTGIPVSWFRDQIANCAASFKMLVLDACHAGALKGGTETNISAQELQLFENLEGVVTLASSTGDQPSQMWPEKTQSLFSYWLTQGLKGHADEDGNGEVNIDELYKYVFRNVTQTAESRDRNLPQTPARKIGLVTLGQPVVVYLKPQSLDGLLTDMSQQLADAIAARDSDKVGVIEFTNDTKLGELLGANYGTLGGYCSSQLEDGLVKEQRNRFKVVNKRTLESAMKKQQFELADLGSGDALKALASKAGGMPLVAVGTLHGRLGSMVNLRCQLIDTESNEVSTVVGGKAFLTESEMAMLGISFAANPEIRRPEVPKAGEPARLAEHVVLDRIDDQAKRPHPLQDPSFPYRVWITVNGKERIGEFRGNDYFVPLRKNEVYEIMIENRSNQVTFMRLLVDGLNTNLESDVESTTDSSAEGESKGIKTEIIGKPVNLNVARGWILNPDDPKRLESSRKSGGNPNRYGVVGFVTKVGENGEMARFTVVDAENSLAARHKFTSQIGIITAAFYSISGTIRHGTVPGEIVKRKLETVEAKPGNLLGAVNIRYYDPDEPVAKN